jgi:hypothetical protein
MNKYMLLILPGIQVQKKRQGACYHPLKDNTKNYRWDIERIN